jgi:hypothetical protein
MKEFEGVVENNLNKKKKIELNWRPVNDGRDDKLFLSSDGKLFQTAGPGVGNWKIGFRKIFANW